MCPSQIPSLVLSPCPNLLLQFLLDMELSLSCPDQGAEAVCGSMAAVLVNVYHDVTLRYFSAKHNRNTKDGSLTPGWRNQIRTLKEIFERQIEGTTLWGFHPSNDCKWNLAAFLTVAPRLQDVCISWLVANGDYCLCLFNQYQHVWGAWKGTIRTHIVWGKHRADCSPIYLVWQLRGKFSRRW